jgi:predicted dehydrogenase
VKPLRLAVLGCGWIARRHAAAARTLRGTVSLSFASRDLARAEAYRAEFGGVAAYGSYEAAVADPAVDGVILCTPLVAEGWLGALRQIHMTAWGIGSSQGWRSSLNARGGGTLIDGGIHYVDLLLQWGGRPTRVFALCPPKTFTEMEEEDTVSLLVEFAGGVVGFLSNSLATPGISGLQWSTLTGTEGTLFVHHRGRFLWLRSRRGQRVRIFLRDWRGYRVLLAEFVGAVTAGHPPEMGGREGRRDLALVLAAYQSLKTGQPVEVEW